MSAEDVDPTTEGPAAHVAMQELAIRLRREAQDIPDPDFKAKSLKTADDIDAMAMVFQAIVEERIDWHNNALTVVEDVLMVSEQHTFAQCLADGMGPVEAVTTARSAVITAAFTLGYELGEGEYNI